MRMRKNRGREDLFLQSWSWWRRVSRAALTNGVTGTAHRMPRLAQLRELLAGER